MPIYSKALPKPYVVTAGNVKHSNDYSIRFDHFTNIPSPPSSDRRLNILSQEMNNSSRSDSPRSSVSAHINNQQIVKTVCEWFESWRPWQQKMVLCGITNRCSTGQLESLATTLEPIFHRDFSASLRKRYPTTPFIVKKAQGKNKKSKTKSTKTQSSVNRLVIDHGSSSPPKSPVSDSNSHSSGESALQLNREMTTSETELMEKLTALEREIEVEEKHKNFVDNLSDFAEEMTTSILEEILDKKEEPKAEPRTIEEFAGNIVQKAIAGALAQFAEGQLESKPQPKPPPPPESPIDLVTDVLGNLDLEKLRSDAMSISIEDAESLNKSARILSPPKKSAISLKQLENQSKAAKRKSDAQARKSHMFMKNGGSVSKHQNSLARHPQSAMNKKSAKSRGQTPLPSTAASRRSLDSTILHRHRSNQGSAAQNMVRSVDFFRGDSVARLGPIQATFRSGSVKKPVFVQDLYLPIQKLYKNAKWFSDQPQPGNMYVKPAKSALQQAYNLQTNQLWKWVETWEDHQRQGLLVELVKRSSSLLVNYLGQCLFQRMKERIDINWLSDQLLLLVFSNLSLEDIDSCSQVGKRWRHLCAAEDLWMYKCYEFGCDVGVPDMIEKVQASKEGDNQIDWRIAFMEVRDLVVAAKNRTPGINDLASLVATPMDMVRLDGKFVPEEEAPSEDTPIEEILVTQIEEPPRKGLAARLRMESEKLRQVAEQRAGISSKIEQRATRQGSSGSDTSRKSDEIWAAREKIREKLLSRPTNASQANGASFKGDDETERESQAESRVESWLQDGPMRMISSRRKGAQDEGEKALDVRPELFQQPDLLNLDSDWVEGSQGKKVKRPVGKVEAVKRCRKFMGHMDSVLCVAFGARRLFSGSMDRSVRIWDIRSGQSIHKLYGHKGGVSCLKFEKDVLYTGSWDMAIMVWNLVTFERIGILTGHRGSVSCLDYNEQYLFSGSHDTTIRVWGRKNMMIKKIIRGHKSHVLCMVLDGDRVISGSSDKTIRITDFVQEECLAVLSLSNVPINRLAVKGNLILSGNTAGEIWFWNKVIGNPEAAIQAHNSPITAVEFRDGRFFTASSDMTMKEWDLYSLTCVRSLQGHKAVINDVSVSSQRVVSCSADGHIRVWDFFTPLQMLNNGPEDEVPTQVVHQKTSKK